MQKQISSKLAALTFGVLAVSFLAAFYVVAWTEPSQAPPDGNVAGPLNIGSTGQTKTGWISAKNVFVGSAPTQAEQNGNGIFRTNGGIILNTGGAATGLIVDKGLVGIGTQSPTQLLNLSANQPQDAAIKFDIFSSVTNGSATFNYTGAEQTWIVPAGATSITVTALGASGGNGYAYNGVFSTGANGARTISTISVTPGETLYIYVGGQGVNGDNGGTGGFNGGGAGGSYGVKGGGGGGASDARRGGNALGNRVVVAGGGGGGGGTGLWTGLPAPYPMKGGDGGSGGQDGSVGGFGGAGVGEICPSPNALGGSGGTQTTGGAGGRTSGPQGKVGVAGGGGGGGYFGGGGGGGYQAFGVTGGSGVGGNGGMGSVTADDICYSGGGGGGGSSFSTGSGTVYAAGANSGNGQVTFNYTITSFPISWTIGADQSDSYKFKISQSTALGTSDMIKIGTDGTICLGSTCKTNWATAPTSPGESVMYLRRYESDGDPSNCPGSWNQIGPNRELVGGYGHKTNTCYRTDVVCQVIYLRIIQPNEPIACSQLSGSNWQEANYAREIDGGSNNVRTCYRCPQ